LIVTAVVEFHFRKNPLRKLFGAMQFFDNAISAIVASSVFVDGKRVDHADPAAGQPCRALS
jgi:hypothetical protein